MPEQTVENYPKQNISFSNRWVYLAIIVILAILVLSGIFLVQGRYKSKPPTSNSASQSSNQDQTNDETQNKLLFPNAQPTDSVKENSSSQNIKITAKDSVSTLENTQVGYRFDYPTGWTVAGAKVATEFQASSDECQSVEIVDGGTYGSGADSGGAGGGIVVNNHSGIQVCAQDLGKDIYSLDQFMQNTYGDNLASWFTKTTLNGITVYQSNKLTTDLSLNRLIFFQTAQYRVQIDAFVITKSDLYETRLAEVLDILKSFKLAPTQFCTETLCT